MYLTYVFQRSMLTVFLLTNTYRVQGDDGLINIYERPKSTWHQNEIVFALNLPFTPWKGSRHKMSGSGYNYPTYYASAAAVAVEDINNDDSILKDNKLRYVWHENETDTHCKELDAVRIQLKQMEIGVHGFVGFTCSCLTVAKNAAAMNLPLFSNGCSQTELSEKKEFPTFARTTAINNEVIHMITSLFERFKWTKFAVICERSHFWQPIYDALNTFVNHDISADITLQETYIKSDTYAQLDHASLAHKFGPFLDKLPKKARVVLLLIERGFIREFMLMASKRGLTSGGYAFIAIHPFASHPGLLHRHNWTKNLAWFLDWNGNASVSPKELIKAYQSLMILMPESPPVVKKDPYFAFEERVRAGMAKPPFNAADSYKYNDTSPPAEAARLYDAVMLYAMGLNETISNGQSITNGTAIVENIKGLKLTSVVGQRYIVNGKADVQTYFSVLQFQFINVTSRHRSGIKDSFGKCPRCWTQRELLQLIQRCPDCWSPKEVFKLIPVYNASRPDLTFKLVGVKNAKPYWLNGLPLDVPTCGFSNENCREERGMSLVELGLVTSLTTLFLLLFLVLLFLYRNHYLRKELNNQMWKIDSAHLYFHDWKGASASSLESLTSLALGTSSTSQRFITAAIYKGDYVAIKKVNRKSVELAKQVLVELKQMRDVRHCNLNQFIGACVEPNNVMVIYQYAAKGSVQDILENSEVKLDTLFILSLVYDIVKGMLYLHSSDIKYHGNLKSSNCVVDSRWVLKITDYGLETFKNGGDKNGGDKTPTVNYNNLLWRAPELLRLNGAGTFCEKQKGDIYSFGIILQECQTRDGAWGSAYQDAETIVERVRKPSNPPYRPIVSQLLDGAEGLRDLMKKCWSENPEERPNFAEIRKDVEMMMKMNGLKTNIFDNMIYMMGKYSDNLEEIVEERTSSLIEEKHKVEALLERMLPKSVARQLMKGKEVEAETFEEVTIYFSDIVGFTTICSSVTPMEVVELLNCLYTMFDSATNDYDVYKVETIGDAYMVVSGLPVRNGKQHIKEICLFALDILENMQSFKARCCDEQLKIRIGVHCGPVVAGVVGTTMPRYCLFGDTVNVAARMESTGEAFRIQVSKVVNNALQGFQGFSTESRGITEVKGKGELETYWLTGIDPGVDQRGSNLRRNQRNLYHCSSPMYNFIRESPITKHIFPKSHATMTDYIQRSPLLISQRKTPSDERKTASDEVTGKKVQKEHGSVCTPLLSSDIHKKTEHVVSNGIHKDVSSNNNGESEQLLRSPVVSFHNNSEADPVETDPLSTDFIEINF